MLDDTLGGAVVLDVGADLGTIETPEVSQGAESVPDSSETVQTPSEQQPIEGQQQNFDAQGKPTPQALKSAFDKLAEGDKKIAEHLRGRYFKAQEYERLFPSPKDALMAKETLETLGGEEGIEQLQQERQQYAAELAMFAEGNPKLLDDLIADSKDGFIKLAPEAFDRLRSIDPQLYNSVALGGFSDILKSSGFPDGLNTMAAGIAEMVDHIQNGRQNEAFGTARNLAAWFSKFKEMAGAGRPKQNEPDERVKAIDQREKELQKTEENNYRQGVNSQLNSEVIKPLLNKHLAPLMKGRTLTPQQKQRLETQIYGDITKEVQSDKRFQDKRRALGERHDTKGIMNLFRPRMEEIIPKVVKSVWAESGFGGAARPAANGNGNQASIVSGKPRPEDIDWSKDKGRTRFMSGEATLKSGKIARWKWENV
jgi:hypothetical protein